MANATEPVVDATEVEEVDAEELGLQPSERYVMYSEWLLDEMGFDVDPLSLEIGVKNYSSFQKSDLNRKANEQRQKDSVKEREDRKKAAEERKKAAAERKAAAEAKKKEREELKAKREEERKNQPAKASAPKGAGTTRRTTTRVGDGKVVRIGASKRTSPKAKASRGKSAASPF